MGVPVLRRPTSRELRRYGLGLERSTPLWHYVLREAELAADGLTLGPVGGRIVAEVFIGLLAERPRLVPRAEAELDSRRSQEQRRSVSG